MRLDNNVLLRSILADKTWGIEKIYSRLNRTTHLHNKEYISKCILKPLLCFAYHEAFTNREWITSSKAAIEAVLSIVSIVA